MSRPHAHKPGKESQIIINGDFDAEIFERIKAKSQVWRIDADGTRTLLAKEPDAANGARLAAYLMATRRDGEAQVYANEAP